MPSGSPTGGYGSDHYTARAAVGSRRSPADRPLFPGAPGGGTRFESLLYRRGRAASLDQGAQQQQQQQQQRVSRAPHHSCGGAAVSPPGLPLAPSTAAAVFRHQSHHPLMMKSGGGVLALDTARRGSFDRSVHDSSPESPGSPSSYGYSSSSASHSHSQTYNTSSGKLNIQITTRHYSSRNQDSPSLMAGDPPISDELSPEFQMLMGPSSVSSSGCSSSSSSNHREQQSLKSRLSSFTSDMSQEIGKLGAASSSEKSGALGKMYKLIRAAWTTPEVGRELAYGLCDTLRTSGGLDMLIDNLTRTDSDHEVKLESAKILEQCLSEDNTEHVLETGGGLEAVVNIASDKEIAAIGARILETLFKHSEETSSRVIELGGLDAILRACRYSTDRNTLRHCALALANLALYGGQENKQIMVDRKAAHWLFPLAFSQDDCTKYYALLAIASLVSHKEFEAAVLKSGTLDLIEPFLNSHNPVLFARSDSHVHGRSESWLKKLVPILSSKCEAATSLAAFHFAIEAWIKCQQGNLQVFANIRAIDALKRVASSPNDLASRFAGQALRTCGEEVPERLIQQVPLWNVDSVQQWLTQIGFASFSGPFKEYQVDGDLLLEMDDKMLREDLNVTNGIVRKRFLRELNQLKIQSDYSPFDPSHLNHYLEGIEPGLSQYTYQMLKRGVTKEILLDLDDDVLANDCLINNGVHRLKILQAITRIRASRCESGALVEKNKSDVFISYRRSNGSQLASLLKVHLQLRGFRVFIDIEKLEAGMFDQNLLQWIRNSKHFILVCTPDALDRCQGDNMCKDWVHKEIVAALDCQCNIVPVIDNFEWPACESLPEDMRAICFFNGIRWIHEYQEACVDKVERFLRSEVNLPKLDTTQTSSKPSAVEGKSIE